MFLHADSEDWSDWADAQADLSLVGFACSGSFFYQTLRIRFLNFSCTRRQARYIWASSWGYGTYRIGDQQRVRHPPEPSLFTHMNCRSRQRVRPKIRHLAPLDGWACVLEEWIYRGQKVPKPHELAHIYFADLFNLLWFLKIILMASCCHYLPIFSYFYWGILYYRCVII